MSKTKIPTTTPTRQRIVRAKYPKGNVVYLFYDVLTSLYSGHFFYDKPVKLENTIKTIQETFPPTFDDVGEFKLRLRNELNLNIEFDYLIPEGGQLKEYEFFETLRQL